MAKNNESDNFNLEVVELAVSGITPEITKRAEVITEGLIEAFSVITSAYEKQPKILRVKVTPVIKEITGSLPLRAEVKRLGISFRQGKKNETYTNLHISDSIYNTIVEERD